MRGVRAAGEASAENVTEKNAAGTIASEANVHALMAAVAEVGGGRGLEAGRAGVGRDVVGGGVEGLLSGGLGVGELGGEGLGGVLGCWAEFAALLLLLLLHLLLRGCLGVLLSGGQVHR